MQTLSANFSQRYISVAANCSQVQDGELLVYVYKNNGYCGLSLSHHRPAWTILGIAKDISRCMRTSLEAIKHSCRGPCLALEGFQMPPNIFRSEVSCHRSSDVALSAPNPYKIPEELSNRIKLRLQFVRNVSTCRGQARRAYRTVLSEGVLSTQRSLGGTL